MFSFTDSNKNDFLLKKKNTDNCTTQHFSQLHLFKKKPDIKMKLESALHYVLSTSIFGAKNKISDIENTGGWVAHQDYRYNVRGKYVKTNYTDYIQYYLFYYLMKYKNNHFMVLLLNNIITMLDRDNGVNFLGRVDADLDLTMDCDGDYVPKNVKNWHYEIDEGQDVNFPVIRLVPREGSKDPLKDPKFNLPYSLKRLLERGILRNENRKANCGDGCILIAKYLWENSDGIDRIEIVAANTFDHVMVIVNREGELHDSTTWGKACWVVDAWYGEQGWIFPGNEFKQNIIEIKRYAKEQLDGFKKYNMNAENPAHRYYKDEEFLQRCIYEIKPNEHLYPTYSKQPFKRVDEYYDLMNMYPADIYSRKSVLDAAKESHQRKFQPCLFAIQQRKNALSCDDVSGVDDRKSMISSTILSLS